MAALRIVVSWALGAAAAGLIVPLDEAAAQGTGGAARSASREAPPAGSTPGRAPTTESTPGRSRDDASVPGRSRDARSTEGQRRGDERSATRARENDGRSRTPSN